MDATTTEWTLGNRGAAASAPLIRLRVLIVHLLRAVAWAAIICSARRCRTQYACHVRQRCVIELRKVTTRFFIIYFVNNNFTCLIIEFSSRLIKLLRMF